MSVSSSSKQYSIVEPHPSVPSSHYISTGRGGAGNVTRAPSSVTRGSDAAGPASRVWLDAPSIASSQSSRKTFITGRGGAGNAHPSSERAIFSFDEELERQLSQERHAAPVYHVGRGGAGNKVVNTSSSQRIYADASSSILRRRSEDSFGSTASVSSESGADYVNRNLKKGFKKMMGNF